MKEFLKAYKLFWKVSFSPVMFFGFAFFYCIGLACIAVSPEKTGSQDFFSALGAIDICHIFIFCSFLIGVMYTKSSKFFTSTRGAKMLYTVAPVVATLTLGLIYDIIVNIAVYLAWEKSALPVFIISNAVSTVLMCVLASTANIPKIGNVKFPICFLIFFAPMALGKLLYKLTLDMTISQSVITAVVIYIVGVSLIILLMNLWWKNRDVHINILISVQIQLYRINGGKHMKKIFKAYKLYMKTNYPPRTWLCLIPAIWFGCVLILGVSTADKSDSTDIIAACAMCGLSHMGLVFFNNLAEKNVKQKFFISTSFAKSYNTIVPLLANLTTGIVFDIAITIILANSVNVGFAINFIMINSIYVVGISFAFAVDALPKISLFGLFVAFVSFFSGFCLFAYIGINQPIYAKILITLAVYVIGTALNIGIMNLWWKKSGRNFKYKEVNKKSLFTA